MSCDLWRYITQQFFAFLSQTTEAPAKKAGGFLTKLFSPSKKEKKEKTPKSPKKKDDKKAAEVGVRSLFNWTTDRWRLKAEAPVEEKKDEPAAPAEPAPAPVVEEVSNTIIV